MIKNNVQKILSELPNEVELEIAVKGRTIEEILQAIDAGVKIIGVNYVQEGERIFKAIDDKVEMHFIGHLQKNKIKKAVEIFDMIETVDSLKLGEAVSKACNRINKIMPVLVEVNSGRENQKFGVLHEDCEDLVRGLSVMGNLKVMGLMTIGPLSGDIESNRRYFMETKNLFDKIKETNIPNIQMKYLSMGMSDTYKMAIEEGANIVRIGRIIFGG